MKYIKHYFNTNKMVKTLPIFFLVLFTFHFSLFTSQPAYAGGQTLRVSPVIITIPLSPGKTSSQEATIENLTNTPLPLRATLNDFITSGEEGGYIFENTKTNPLLSWIKLSDTDFILGAKEKKTIQMTITTPTTIPLGGYYGLLFFEPVLQTQLTTNTRVNTKVGILMLANLGVTDKSAKKADILTFTPSQLSQDGAVPFMLRVQNISLNFFTAKPIMHITPLIPNVIPDLIRDPNILDSRQRENDIQTKPTYLEEKLIFPGKIRRWTEDATIHDLSPNIYQIHLAVSTGNGQQVTAERYIIVFPVLKALGILLIFVVVIFLTIKRRRLGKAARALFRS